MRIFVVRSITFRKYQIDERYLTMIKQRRTRHSRCYACICVFDHEKPTLLVSRPDGDWCFLCGDLHEDNADNYRVVGMSHLLHQDPTLEPVLDLPPDWEAERTTVDGHWVRSQIPPQ
ncbi:hypothetical protein CHELA1G11_21706 [Hyphomicrobiales bacterium]|nr:hypothetical protein CHELA1G11_21706 [Hyphomicrobiales bacterium]